MCGRYTLTRSASEIAEHFGAELDEEAAALGGRFNLAPSQTVPVLRVPEPGAAPRLEGRRWGLVPSWARDPAIGARLVNARLESVRTKPAYRAAVRRRRCLLPADGFYEWRSHPTRGREPHWVHLDDGGLFAFAGLYERWRGEDGALLATCALLTTEAGPALADLHPRMPVLVDPEDRAAWLDPETQDAAPLLERLPGRASERLAYRPVTRRVNSPHNEGPACLEAPEPTTLRIEDF